MFRSALALALVLTYGGIAFGVRTWMQLRRHGDSGWRFSRPAGWAAFAHAAFVVSILAIPAASVVALALGAPHRPLGPAALTESGAGWVTATAGILICLAAMALTLLAQMQMAESWRIGVDPEEQTRLVTTGLFRYLRNPIFTSIGLFVVGQALLVPNALMLVTLLAGSVGLQSQVRQVEEPYLARMHGDAYMAWAQGRGRFLPGVGKGVPAPTRTETVS